MADAACAISTYAKMNAAAVGETGRMRLKAVLKTARLCLDAPILREYGDPAGCSAST
jgi:hypothetical protein